MGKFKEIDQYCEDENREGLIEFLAENGIQNPHKQANVYLKEYRMNKTEPDSENKKPILDKILELMSERISTLNERASVLSSRIDVVNERIDNLFDKLMEK